MKFHIVGVVSIITAVIAKVNVPGIAEDCEIYFDGCNVCRRTGACTRKYCATPGTPQCLSKTGVEGAALASQMNVKHMAEQGEARKLQALNMNEMVNIQAALAGIQDPAVLAQNLNNLVQIPGINFGQLPPDLRFPQLQMPVSAEAVNAAGMSSLADLLQGQSLTNLARSLAYLGKPSAAFDELQKNFNALVANNGLDLNKLVTPPVVPRSLEAADPFQQFYDLLATATPAPVPSFVGEMQFPPLNPEPIQWPVDLTKGPVPYWNGTHFEYHHNHTFPSWNVTMPELPHLNATLPEMPWNFTMPQLPHLNATLPEIPWNFTMPQLPHLNQTLPEIPWNFTMPQLPHLNQTLPEMPWNFTMPELPHLNQTLPEMPPWNITMPEMPTLPHLNYTLPSWETMPQIPGINGTMPLIPNNFSLGDHLLPLPGVGYVPTFPELPGLEIPRLPTSIPGMGDLGQLLNTAAGLRWLQSIIDSAAGTDVAPRMLQSNLSLSDFLGAGLQAAQQAQQQAQQAQMLNLALSTLQQSLSNIPGLINNAGIPDINKLLSMGGTIDNILPNVTGLTDIFGNKPPAPAPADVGVIEAQLPWRNLEAVGDQGQYVAHTMGSVNPSPEAGPESNGFFANIVETVKSPIQSLMNIGAPDESNPRPAKVARENALRRCAQTGMPVNSCSVAMDAFISH